MQIENENSFKAVLLQQLNLFLGAGFSVLAKDCAGNALPLGRVLASEIVSQFKLDRLTHLELPQLCTVVERSHRAELRRFLEQRFKVDSWDSRYLHLLQLKIDAIFTTNIDDLVFKIFASSDRCYVNDIQNRGPAFRDRAAIDYVALHGCIRNKDAPFRFGTPDLASAFAADSDRWRYLTRRLQQVATLFWGYSLSDAGSLQALSRDSIEHHTQRDRWMVVHPSADEATEEYFRSLDFQIIRADTQEMLDYIGKVAPKIATPPPTPLATPSRFPDESVPQQGAVPIRPILDFFQGSPPQWSDIFLGKLYRTTAFNRIKNLINANKNVVVIGIPACGKTTLMMQLAADIEINAHKLICGTITFEKAGLLVAKLRGDAALIFVDNFVDSLDAVLLFLKQPNIKIVCADRDYNFAIIAHRLDPKLIDPVNVSELSPADIQSCLDTIPTSIRNSAYNRPETSHGVAPSLFEIIEANLMGPTLKARFKTVLAQLERENPSLKNMLLMMSYVQSCRTPVSMDMLIAFIREVTTDYKEIYKMRTRLGAVVTDYVGDLSDALQDYYVPRSTIVASAVLDCAANLDLKQVLLTFHKNVSPYRICHYDVFKKRAYDADLMNRAFSNWSEGLKFYEDLYNRDRSPYLLQQAATYLSRRGQFIEAFKMIDAAITASGGRIWSIRNSHAVILFKANIEHFSDPIARQQLQKSMEILTECYQWDKRKPYHASTFAEQAVEYWERYRDDEAREHLLTAVKWLEEEIPRCPWHQGLRNLLPKVKLAISRG